jgi:DnaJ-class molecular chaperone
MMKTNYYHKSFEYQDEYDYEKLGERGIEANATRIVCPTCNGDGRHFRTDLDENAMVGSFQEDMDDDGMEAYQGGAFDQVCTECNGRNVVDEVDWSSIPKWASDCANEWDEEEAMNERVRFAENGYRN